MMPILPPIVAFDLDGTLAETAGDLVGTLNVILEREGLKALPLELARDMIGAGAKALIQRGFAAAGETLAPDHLDRLFAEFLAHYGANLSRKSYLYPGVVAALDTLRARGFRLAVCTNKFERHAVDLLRELGIGDRFAAICGRETFAFAKPDPRHITLTIARAGGDPDRAVMVGDSRSDVEAAQAAGIPSVCVSFGYSDIPIRELKPDRIIDHFEDLGLAVDALVPRPFAFSEMRRDDGGRDRDRTCDPSRVKHAGASRRQPLRGA